MRLTLLIVLLLVMAGVVYVLVRGVIGMDFLPYQSDP